MAVYELLGMSGETEGSLLALVAAYTRAHEAVRADDLESARKYLTEAMTHKEGDGPTLWLAHLVDDLAAGKRPRPWNGVYVLDEK